MIVGMGIDWNAFMLYGVPAYIAAAGAAIAAVLGARNHRSLQMSNGQSIAQGVEATHAAVSAGALVVDKISDTQDHPTEGGTGV